MTAQILQTALTSYEFFGIVIAILRDNGLVVLKYLT